MKAIQPVSIWANGVNSQATQLSLTIINDNLDTSATLYYQLLTEDGIQLAQGNLTIDGEEYHTWGEASSDINNEAYVIAANKLSLTLIQD
jgi:hypothetical protein